MHMTTEEFWRVEGMSAQSVREILSKCDGGSVTFDKGFKPVLTVFRDGGFRVARRLYLEGGEVMIDTADYDVPYSLDDARVEGGGGLVAYNVRKHLEDYLAWKAGELEC